MNKAVYDVIKRIDESPARIVYFPMRVPQDIELFRGIKREIEKLGFWMDLPNYLRRLPDDYATDQIAMPVEVFDTVHSVSAGRL